MDLIKTVIYHLFCIIPIHKLIEWLQNEDRRRHCFKNTVAEDVVFHPEAIVDNLQNDSSKIAVGKGTNIRGTLLVFSYGGRITVGSNCYLGKDSNIWSASQIEIGNDVLISHNVNIIDTNSHELDYEDRAKSYVEMTTIGHPKNVVNVDSAPIKIGNHVWINFNCTILKGVTIGNGAIVAAGSVVTKNIEPFTVVAGNPAKVIKQLNGSKLK